MHRESSPAAPAATSGAPRLSVIVLNYNGGSWLTPCLDSLQQQTWSAQLEVIVADNASTDGSDVLAKRRLESWPRGRFIQHGANLGYCEGNNRAAREAAGTWLLFLNNDTRLEPACLEALVTAAERAGVAAGCPRVLNYGDDSFQSLGAFGFDLFGLPSTRGDSAEDREVFMPEGCAYLVRSDVFRAVGGFDPEFFMYADEWDLSWRLWLAGYTLAAFPSARLHHQGAAQLNPVGTARPSAFRTSDTKRYYANRNGLLAVLKNAQHLLLALVPLQIALLGLEAVAGLCIVRRGSFIRRAYLDAILDCWRLRSHWLAERCRIRALRRRGDLWMLRFLCWRPNRLDEIVRVRRQGLPSVKAG